MHRVKAITEGMPDPPDYFLGVNPIPSSSPRNVLQFFRRKASNLSNPLSPARHRRFVMIANLGSSGCAIVDGSTIALHRGEGLLIFPFQSHHYTRLPEGSRADWLFTTFEYEKPAELEPLRDTPFRYEERDIQRLTRLTSTFRQFAAGRASGAASPFELALILSGLLQRREKYLSTSGGLPADKFPNIDFLQAVTLYIHRNLSRPVTMDEIAAAANLSVSRLRSKFKQVTGKSLGSYIRETRIYKARALLSNTDLTVTQIAESCGFDSLFSFSRAFSRMTGASPRTFRKELKSKANTLRIV